MSRDASPPARGRFYRLARLWHAWLSAAAFLALIFFAGTGLMLNNPDWWETRPAARTESLTLSPAELTAALAASEPDRALARTVADRLDLRGLYQKPKPTDPPGKIRLRGVTGGSEIAVDRKTGQVKVKTEQASLAAVITNLHKGKNAGAAWRLLIDAVAVTVLALSILGYILVFSLRFRLRTSLLLTAATLALAALLFFAAVP